MPIANPINFTYTCTVENVVDGDTLDVRIDLGFRMTTVQRVRLLGVDAPEVGTPYAENATRFLELYLGKPLWIRTQKADSFGRYLGTLVCPFTGDNINEYLIAYGYAKPWKGK